MTFRVKKCSASSVSTEANLFLFFLVHVVSHLYGTSKQTQHKVFDKEGGKKVPQSLWRLVFYEAVFREAGRTSVGPARGNLTSVVTSSSTPLTARSSPSCR